MRVFLDANILFSASDPDSATRQLLDVVAKEGRLITNPHAWEEARRNLALKRPEFLSGLKELLPRIHISSLVGAVPETTLDAMDLPILAGAIGAGCTHLWTSDWRHFGRYYGRRLSGVLVVSILDLAKAL
jgi:predicted nucleic acid-binding protein